MLTAIPLKQGIVTGTRRFARGKLSLERGILGGFGLVKSWWALGDEGDVDCLTKRGRWGETD